MSFDGCGVYKIMCIVTGDCYVGGSLDMSVSIAKTRDELDRRRQNSAFQSAFDQFGPGAFDVEVLEHCRNAKDLAEALGEHTEAEAPTLNLAASERARPPKRGWWSDLQQSQRVAKLV